MIEEHRVHCLPDRVISTERERQVAHSSAHPGKGEVCLNIFSGFDVINCIVIVLLDACGDGQDIGIDEDVLRRETGFLRQQTVRSVSHLPAFFEGGSLSLLVKEHHHRGSAVAPHQPGFLQEILLTLLQADGVDNRFALYALQPCLQHLPLRRIDHDGKLRDVRLAHQYVDEPSHGCGAVNHGIIHAYVNHLCATLHLVTRHIERCREIPLADQPRELY